MATGSTPRLDSIVAGTQGFVDESALISVPYTTIVGRAQIPDIANDLKASLGIERIPVQQIYPIQDEFGPNGEPVWGALNDTRGLMRFVGNWVSSLDTHGIRAGASIAGDYVEVTFYGTGLNVLSYCVATQDARCTVDGGSEGSNFVPQGSGVLLSRNASGNQVYTVASGLSLGVHTAKLRMANANGFSIFGFEIINPNVSGLININPGVVYNKGAKYTNSVADSVAYATGYTPASNSNKGARIVRYINANDTISQAVTMVDTSAAYGNSASHTNEEVVRVYNPREFGAGLTTDFALLAPSPARPAAFTLEDGTTSLVASNAVLTNTNGRDCLNGAGGYAWITLTFVGTGVDVIYTGNTSGTNSNVNGIQFYIDGGSANDWSTAVAPAGFATQKLASGLAYGTHTLKLAYNNPSVWTAIYSQFIVYGPKKPALPTGAVEIADYNVMANFVANTVAGLETKSTGILSKTPYRELVFVGSSWDLGNVNDRASTGIGAYTTTSGDYIDFTFFGTGFDWRFPFYSDGTNNATVSLQALSSGGSLLPLSSTNFPGLTTSTYGVLSKFTYGSGNLDQYNGSTVYGGGLVVSGLTLGLYKVRVAKGSNGANMRCSGIDIITPIHTHKSNGYAVLQNTLPVGSTSLLDTRATSYAQTQKAWAQAVGVNTTTATSSLTFVPCPDLSVTIKTSGKAIRVSFLVNANNAGAQGVAAIFVDGMKLSTEMAGFYDSDASSRGAVGDSIIVPVSKGEHKVDIHWRVTGGTLNGYDVMRSLTVEEV
jgi:hypothetical protein